MRIDSHAIGMESARTFTSQTKHSVSAFAVSGNSQNIGQTLIGMGFSKPSFAMMLPWHGDEEPATQKEEDMSAAERAEELRNRLNGFSTKAMIGSGSVYGSRERDTQLMTIRQQCLNFLLRLLFWGKGQKFEDFAREDAANCPPPVTARETEEILVTGATRTFEYSETETTSFTTQGTVRCADGREIEFNLNMVMSREFYAVYEESSFSMRRVFTDPLVINLSGNIAELSDQTFYFDIDNDGEVDNIAMLGAGSGYLALDHNGDGQINDGGELFGTASGNGFTDLAAHDHDRNGWIDEADEIWEKLLIWVMEPDGSSSLYTLAEKGLGAIFLGSAGTDFTLTNEVNEAKGAIRSSGLFLYESGAVGSVQQVDVVKFEA